MKLNWEKVEVYYVRVKDEIPKERARIQRSFQVFSIFESDLAFFRHYNVDKQQEAGV